MAVAQADLLSNKPYSYVSRVFLMAQNLEKSPNGTI